MPSLHACRVSGSEERAPHAAAAMVRGSLGKLASRALSVAGKWQHQQLRRLNIHEYQVLLQPPHQIPQIPAPYSVRFLRVFFFGVFDLGAWANALGFVDVWVSQGAELMGKYGINVPRGAAAGSVEEIKNTLKNVFPSEKEVMFPFLILYCLCGQFETWLWQLFDGIRMYIENVVYCNFC